MKVVDASAMIELLSRTAKAATLEVLLDDDLFAPDLLIAEVIHHFRRLLRGQTITSTTAADAVHHFAGADIEYVPVWPLTERIWTLRDNLSAYDACYVALAEDLACPLVTTDVRLSTASGLKPQIITV